MKKLISIFLAVVMLTTCVGISGFAATDVSFGSTTLEDMIDILDRNMPGTQERRAEVFNVLAMYLENDTNLDALIDMAETLTASGDDAEILGQIITALGTDLSDNQDTVLFTLDLLRALPAAKRAAAITAFKNAQAAVDAASTDGWVSEAEAGVVLETVDQAALGRIYDGLVNNDGEPGDAQLASHGIGINTILRLSFAFQNSLVLTDASVGSADFAVKTISDDFKDGLYTYVTEHFNAINGDEIADGEDVINALVAALNGFDAEMKADIKTVLGASEIALYEVLTDEDDDDDDDDDDSSGSSGSYRPIGGYLGGSDTVDMSKEVGNIKPDMSASVGEPASAEAAYIYTDTADHWAKDYIGELSKRGIFNGYEDGSFRPDLGITREEMAVALTRALDIEDKARRAPYYNYTDSSYISTWALDAVNMMSKLGVFTGYDDGSYKPQQVITREQMVAVIMRMFDDSVPKTALNFTDKHVIGDWAVGYVESATTLGIIAGYPDGTFRAANYITRAEAAKILYMFMHYANLL